MLRLLLWLNEEAGGPRNPTFSLELLPQPFTGESLVWPSGRGSDQPKAGEGRVNHANRLNEATCRIVLVLSEQEPTANISCNAR